jgi:predicted RNA binding protein YcfA (HicA-like mRNA interferase family)
MRLPRDLSGEDLAALLRRRYSYRLVRQRGSHMTLTGTVGGVSHSVTVPRHRVVQVGTLSRIVADVAAHLGVTQDEVRRELFGS